MFNLLYTLLFILSAISFNVSAESDDNPFAKNKSLDIGKQVHWRIDKAAGLATKSSGDRDGAYYHLRFDNKQLELVVSDDEKGSSPKKFSNLEIKDIAIDGKQTALFAWCLNNQQRHSRFLQQGLSVKKDICKINGNKGQFIIRLDREALIALRKGKNLSITIKPFRAPLKLNYDISDFQEMYLALNLRNKPAVAKVTSPAAPVVSIVESRCLASPPEKYKTIQGIEYLCEDVSAKLAAEAEIIKQVKLKRSNEKKLAIQRAAEKEKIRKRSEDKKQKELAAKVKQEKLLQAESAAIAASEAKQTEIGNEITLKMISVCEKYWNKGEHRCYCQKYIEHAPDGIAEKSTCG